MPQCFGGIFEAKNQCFYTRHILDRDSTDNRVITHILTKGYSYLETELRIMNVMVVVSEVYFHV